MILVTASKAIMCTKAEVDWTKVDSDHVGVQIWLDIFWVLWFLPTIPLLGGGTPHMTWQ